MIIVPPYNDNSANTQISVSLNNQNIDTIKALQPVPTPSVSIEALMPTSQNKMRLIQPDDYNLQNIENKYEPQIPGYVILNSKQKILQLTGPDALSRAINTCITNNIIKHRNIDYYKYFTLSFKNYHLMYTTKKHYSQYNEPLYKQA